MKILKDWELCAIDVDGQLGGLLAIWNFKTSASILLEGKIPGLEYEINLLNIYAPYRDIRPFWKNIENSGILNLENLVIGGDLNFTMYA